MWSQTCLLGFFRHYSNREELFETGKISKWTRSCLLGFSEALAPTHDLGEHPSGSRKHLFSPAACSPGSEEHPSDPAARPSDPSARPHDP